jgi:hypothetical protein
MSKKKPKQAEVARENDSAHLDFQSLLRPSEEAWKEEPIKQIEKRKGKDQFDLPGQGQRLKEATF